jgi:hypothetical protein
MICAIEMASGGIYISRFMTIDTDVKAILNSPLRNLKGCNVGIIGGRNL